MNISKNIIHYDNRIFLSGIPIVERITLPNVADGSIVYKYSPIEHFLHTEIQTSYGAVNPFVFFTKYEYPTEEFFARFESWLNYLFFNDNIKLEHREYSDGKTGYIYLYDSVNVSEIIVCSFSKEITLEGKDIIISDGKCFFKDLFCSGESVANILTDSLESLMFHIEFNLQRFAAQFVEKES